jgi:general secretion pathway protein A
VGGALSCQPGDGAMYCPFFGLQEKPFSITPDPRFLFLSASHQEALGHLLYGIEERKGFITITGEVGTGKTLLCRALLERLGRHVRTALIFNSFLLEIELLRAINEDFGLGQNGASRKELVDHLNQYLLAEFRAGRNAVLIIDEAQNLAPALLEQIRMLSNLETERGKLLQIVLVGQPELRQQLARPELRQLNQRIALRYHLQPFDQQETQEYITHRLVVAGSHGSVKFSRRALSSIFRHSDGIPRKINLLCDRAMLSAYVHGSSLIGQTHVRQAWKELEGYNGSRFLSMTRRQPGRRSRVVQGLIVGLALTVGGGAWLGLHWQRVRALPIMVPGHLSETSAQASLNSAEITAEVSAETQSTGVLVQHSDIPLQLDGQGLTNNGIDENTSTLAPVEDATTPSMPELNGFSPPSLAGEVLLRTLLVELRRDLRQQGTSAKTMLAQVSSSFGLEMLPVRIDVSHLKQFRVACLLETYPADTADPTFLIVRGVSPGGVELTDASGDIRRLEDMELGQSWHGQAYLFHRRGSDLKQILSRGKQTPDVRLLQQRLRELGYLWTGPSGHFDDDTMEAVRRLQKEYALQVDGAAGPATKIVLYHLAGRSLAEVRQE